METTVTEIQFDPSFLLLGGGAMYALLLVIVAYFTRATRRRFLSALAGGAAVAIVGVGIEFVCEALGFWRYPFSSSPVGPPLLYPAVALQFAVLALIVWRVTRRFGAGGGVWLLVTIGAIGAMRDYGYSAFFPQLMTLKPGFITLVVDVSCWIGLTGLAAGVMRRGAGPAANDPLSTWRFSRNILRQSVLDGSLKPDGRMRDTVLDTAIQAQILADIEADWRKMSEEYRPSGVWIRRYAPLSAGTDIVDSRAILEAVWFLDVGGLRVENVENWVRFKALRRSSISKQLVERRAHEIGFASFAFYEGGESCYYDTVWGVLWGAGWRSAIKEGRLLEWEDLWVS